MKAEIILAVLAISLTGTCAESKLVVDGVEIVAETIERFEKEGRSFIRASGNAYLLLTRGEFRGYSFGSITSPIEYSIDDNSVRCSGWFVATNGDEMFHFGATLANESEIVFHTDGRRSGSGRGVMKWPRKTEPTAR